MAQREPVSGFRDDRARERFMQRYEQALRKWPVPRAEMDVRTRFGSVHVHRCGASAGTPVVLLHGLAATSASWYPNVGPLAARHPVYAVDALGEQGRSVQETPIRDAADSAQWIEDAFAELSIDRAHLIGVSHGGYLSANYAARFPDRIASLALLEPVGLTAVNGRNFLFSVLRDLLALGAPRPLASRLSTGTIATDAGIRRLSMASARDFKIRLPKAGVLTDDQLRRLTMPTLVLLAGCSSVHDPEDVADRLRPLLPAADVEVVPAAAHNFTMDSAALVNGRLADFLAAAE